MAEIGKDLDRAKAILEHSGVIGFPTETVYGLAGNALDEDAILKIYEVKNRPKFDPLIAHTDSLEKVNHLVQEMPEEALKLASTFWPGPMTLLLNKTHLVPDLLTSGLARIAVRVPEHQMARELLSMLDFPLAAPSANPFGFVSPTSAQHVNDQLGGHIEYILDGGECRVGVESTVIGFEKEGIVVHRLGGLSVEEIEACVGPVKLTLNKSSNPQAPGQLKSHYSPGKRVVIGDIGTELARVNGSNVGVISFDQDYRVENQVILSPTGDLNEAARGIFAALRKFKDSEVELIISQKFPERGLGRAINDRLQRASV